MIAKKAGLAAPVALPQGGALPSNALNAASPGRDPFVLRYLRFRCKNAKKTQDFYQTLGMTIDRQQILPITSDFQRTPHPTLGGPKGEGALPGATTAFGAAAKPPLNPPGTPSHPSQRAAADFGSTKPVVKLMAPDDCLLTFTASFRGTPIETIETHPVHLVFECPPEDEDEPQKKQDIADGSEDSIAEDFMQKKGPPGLPKEFERFNVKATDKEQITRPKTARNSEYLLFYVHLLLRVMKRMSAKGFTVVIPPTELSDRIKVAVLRDPSDMEVRLVELADAQFEEVASPPGPQPHQTPSTPSHSKKQWFCRLGYYTIPTARADETVKMYEKLFAQVAAIPGVPAGPGGPKKVDGPKPRVRMAFRKPANNPPQIAPVLTGFHQIDTEESVYGLSKTRCHWMGHESRNSGCTICFTELERADLKKILQVDRTSSRLIAVGFEVANLDAAAKRIDSDKAADLLLEPGGRVRVPGEGHFNRWKETINNICVELFVHKPPEQTAEGAKVTTEVVSLNERITGVAKDGEMAKLEIDYDHLYGLTRFLSAGAIRSVPTKPTATSARADRKTEQQKKPGQPSSQQKSSDARDIPAFRGESSGDREPKQTGDEVSGTKIKTIKVKMLRLKQGIELPPVGRTGHAENVRGPAAKVKNIPLGSQGKSSSMNW